MRRPRSWSMRFALALSAVFIVGTVVAGGLSYVLMSREMSRLLDQDVRVSAENLAAIEEVGGKNALTEQIEAQMRTLREGTGLVAYIDAETMNALGTLKISEPFEGSSRLNFEDDSSAQNDTYRAFGIKIESGWVIAARNEAWVAENGEIIAKSTSWALVVALALSLGLAWIMARRNQTRIVRIEKALQAIGTGNLTVRIKDPGNDDLAEVADSVDQMLNQLEAGVDAIRQVSTDVAHDLRAPLARLRMRLEPQVFLQDVPEDTRMEIGSALQDIDTISSTFDAILRLARLQSGSVQIGKEPVDLNILGQEVFDIFEASAEDLGHTLHLERKDIPVLVQGDRELITQAMVNLLDNAMRHCPSPSEISLQTGISPDRGAFFEVLDSGPGIPSEDLNRVLQRFVRLDSSRTVSGTGLGLSLVSAIAHLHGAELTLKDNKPGLCVNMTFPKVG